MTDTVEWSGCVKRIGGALDLRPHEWRFVTILRAVCMRVFVLLCSIVLFACLGMGCAGPFAVRGNSGREDPFLVYADIPGFVVIQGEKSRALVRLDQDASVICSRHEDGFPLIMEHPSGAQHWYADRHADRLLIGLADSSGVPSGDWRITQQDLDGVATRRTVYLDGGNGAEVALTIEREIRMLGAHALGAFFSGELPAGLRVSGYESRTVFANPGPLPWPRGNAVPHIRTEGDILRRSDAVFILHVQAESGEMLARQVKGASAAVASAFVGRGSDTDGFRIVLPVDFVLPRIALIDRTMGMLTLIAYTPPPVTISARDVNQHRVDPEIQLAGVDGSARWYRVVTAGVALPLATGGSVRHHRHTFHVQGEVERLLRVGAAFCRLPLDDLVAALALLERGQEP
ncbi:MAG: hypothetical protein ACNA71_03375 [Kiritimatiellia bacterium]